MVPRILITGGSGLLALNWAFAIRDKYQVILGLHERNILLTNVVSTKINLESVDSLVRSFQSNRVDLVIHAAGLANVEQCERNQELAYLVNVVLANNVSKACALAGVRLVHISTDHLFSGHEPMVEEGHPVAPLNVYAETKAEAEQRVLDANPETLVIRTNFYGWGTSYRQSFSDLVIGALRSGVQLTLFKDVFYTPILIEELAFAVHDLIDLKASGIYNVVGNQRVSKFQFGELISKEFDLDFGVIKSGYFSNQATLVSRPHDMSLSNLKASKLLGRQIGGPKEDLIKLHQQESNGLAREMKFI